MRYYGVLIAIIFFVSEPSLGASALCRVMLEAIDQAQSKELVEEVLRRVEKWLAKKKVVHDDDNYYAPYVRIRRGSDTLHFETDSRVILSLPKSGELTVWGSLSRPMKQELVKGLAKLLIKGHYDEGIREGGPASADTTWALEARELKGHDPHDVGFSPTEILRGAVCGRKIGVCRHANVALAGLLGELGIPNGDIRFRVGSQRPDSEESHIWVEYRLTSSEAARWYEVDATPKGQDPTELFLTRLFFDSLPSNWKKFRYHQLIIRDFLVPRVRK